MKALMIATALLFQVSVSQAANLNCDVKSLSGLPDLKNAGASLTFGSQPFMMLTGKAEGANVFMMLANAGKLIDGSVEYTIDTECTRMSSAAAEQYVCENAEDKAKGRKYVVDITIDSTAKTARYSTWYHINANTYTDRQTVELQNCR